MEISEPTEAKTNIEIEEKTDEEKVTEPDSKVDTKPNTKPNTKVVTGKLPVQNPEAVALCKQAQTDM